MQANNAASNNVLGIDLSIYAIATSFIFLFIGLYFSEKHPVFLICMLICSISTITYMAFRIGTGTMGKHAVAWTFVSILAILTVFVFYYLLIIKSPANQAAQISPEEARKIIDEFHNSINEENCVNAYSLFTDRFIAANKLNLPDFTGNCKKTKNLRLNGEPSSIEDVMYFYTQVQWKHNGTQNQENTVWGLKRDNGKLKIDAKLKTVGN